VLFNASIVDNIRIGRRDASDEEALPAARALLKDAPIVLHHEPTASLDVEHESRIPAGISEVIHRKREFRRDDREAKELSINNLFKYFY
jgi:ATP-binding cassette subfamily B protein